MMKISNNLIAVLIVLYMVSILIFNYSLYSNVTGRVTSSVGQVNICVGGIPEISNIEPSTGLVEGTINVSASAFYASGDANVTNATFSYGGQENGLIGSDTFDGDENFSFFWDTSTVSDGICAYIINVFAPGNCADANEDGGLFTIDNVKVEPSWENFKNNFTTNLSNYSEWMQLENLTIGNEYGEVYFANGSHVDLDNFDLDSNFMIQQNLIYGDSWVSGCYPTYPHITLKNLPYLYPEVWVDGTPCDNCTILSYIGGNLTFTDNRGFEGTYYTNETAVLMVNITMDNETQDNSPTFNLTTFIVGLDNSTTYVDTNCTYMTDYDPVSYTLMDFTDSYEHSQEMPAQPILYQYISSPSLYDYVQHRDYLNGDHILRVLCNGSDLSVQENFTFRIKPPTRDKVFYKNLDPVSMVLTLEESGLNVSANFSQIDSDFDVDNLNVDESGLVYNITYIIDSSSAVSDGQYNVTTEAFDGPNETMNNSMFFHMHQADTWTWEDADHAVSCYTRNPGWYFDEVACSWASDVNFAIKKQAYGLVEERCDDGFDNDQDGTTDCDDTDCDGIMYSCRNDQGLDSAIWLDDPCLNNLCWFSLGATTVYYTLEARPGYPLKVKFVQNNLVGKTVQVALNNLSATFGVTDNTTDKRQLATKLFTSSSLTAKSFTPDGDDTNDTFTGNLSERLEVTIPLGHPDDTYAVEFVRSIDDSSGSMRTNQYMGVSSSAIVDESDYLNSSGLAEYCIDGIDNELDSNLTFVNGTWVEEEFIDCKDPDCDNEPIMAGVRCNYRTEDTCDDGFDNDGDGYTDCEDNDCFKDGDSCPGSEQICYDYINNDHDYGYFGVPGISVSYEDSSEDMINLTDCLDVSCNGRDGNLTTGARCEFGNESTCDDAFDNDADGVFDCNVSGTSYDRDCDRWNSHGANYVCPSTELICYDNDDNDLDYDYPDSPQFGGVDCGDVDCDGEIGNLTLITICEYGSESICDDLFDNDRDGDTDCVDFSCFGSGGSCYSCPATENVTLDSCSDGRDNDGDNVTDCADSDCIGMLGPNSTICGATETSCIDGIDNDLDDLIDCLDDDCPCFYSYSEFCRDGIDNDGDSSIDCNDTECVNSSLCLGLGTYPGLSSGTLSGMTYLYTDLIKPGDNFTLNFVQSLSNSTVLLLAGHVSYPLSQLNPLPNDTNTFISGTTSGFVKLVNNNTLQVENNVGFAGGLNITLGIEATEMGTHDLRITKSTEGSAGYSDIEIYVVENEAPHVVSALPIAGTNSSEKWQDIVINATDEGTYNSGIDRCEINISGTIYVENDCRIRHYFNAGTHTVRFRVYDGMENYVDNSTNFTIISAPYQDGEFYAYTNYPSKTLFNDSELLGIGVNFNSTNTFTPSSTGCNVNLYSFNGTYIGTEQVALLNRTTDYRLVSCTGEVNISDIVYTLNESDNIWFEVNVTDNQGETGVSERHIISLCSHRTDQFENFRCLDSCELLDLVNDPPYLFAPIPNQTWERNTYKSGLDLDDYFMDPEGDVLTYNSTSVNSITITIDSNGVVTFQPETNWYGFRYVTFTAEDPYGESAISNEVLLRVVDTPDDLAEGGGGGGGGGGSIPPVRPDDWCTVNWTCGAWTVCQPDGLQYRVCEDLNNCENPALQPNATKNCTYDPSCSDGIKNNGERGVDCGGPCAECPTCLDGVMNGNEEGVDCGGICKPCDSCYDGIRNQDEERTDCGGVCQPCPTCHDEIQNQGEQGIDVGGPCPPKRLYEEPRLYAGTTFWWLALFLLLWGVVGTIFYTYYGGYVPEILYRTLQLFPSKKIPKKEGLGNITLRALSISIREKADPRRKADNVMSVMRIFFKESYESKYSSSPDEIVEVVASQVDNILLKELVSQFFHKANEMAYGTKEHSDDDVRLLADIAKKIVVSSLDLSNKEIKDDWGVPLTEKTKVFQDLDRMKNKKRTTKHLDRFHSTLQKIDISLKTKFIHKEGLEKIKSLYSQANELYGGMSKKERLDNYAVLRESFKKILKIEKQLGVEDEKGKKR